MLAIIDTPIILVSVFIFVVCFLPWFLFRRILERAGISPSVALFVFIPYLGVVVVGFILAFARWPNAKDDPVQAKLESPRSPQPAGKIDIGRYRATRLVIRRMIDGTSAGREWDDNMYTHKSLDSTTNALITLANSASEFVPAVAKGSLRSPEGIRYLQLLLDATAVCEAELTDPDTAKAV